MRSLIRIPIFWELGSELESFGNQSLGLALCAQVRGNSRMLTIAPSLSRTINVILSVSAHHCSCISYSSSSVSGSLHVCSLSSSSCRHPPLRLEHGVGEYLPFDLRRKAGDVYLVTCSEQAREMSAIPLVIKCGEHVTHHVSSHLYLHPRMVSLDVLAEVGHQIDLVPRHEKACLHTL